MWAPMGVVMARANGKADKAASSDLSLRDEPPPQSQPIAATTAR